VKKKVSFGLFLHSINGYAHAFDILKHIGTYNIDTTKAVIYWHDGRLRALWLPQKKMLLFSSTALTEIFLMEAECFP